MSQRLSPMLIVDDLERPQAFYERFFGFQTTFDSPGYKGLVQPESNIELGFMRPDDDCTSKTTNGQGLLFGLQVDDVDAEHQRLVALGAEPHGAPTDKPWGDRSFSMTDPCGVTLHIYQPAVPQAEFAQYVVPAKKKA